MKHQNLEKVCIKMIFKALVYGDVHRLRRHVVFQRITDGM